MRHRSRIVRITATAVLVVAAALPTQAGCRSGDAGRAQASRSAGYPLQSPGAGSLSPGAGSQPPGAGSLPPGSLPPGGTSCAAMVTLDAWWTGGFQGTATIRNTGSTDLHGWYVSWMIPIGAAVTQAWQGTLMVSGPSIMIHAPAWAQRLAPGASATAGFLGTGSTAPTFTSVGCG